MTYTLDIIPLSKFTTNFLLITMKIIKERGQKYVTAIKSLTRKRAKE